MTSSPDHQDNNSSANLHLKLPITTSGVACFVGFINQTNLHATETSINLIVANPA